MEDLYLHCPIHLHDIVLNREGFTIIEMLVIKYEDFSTYDVRCGRLLWFTKIKLHGLSPRANYTERVTAACR
jgi:hypothetical protein